MTSRQQWAESDSAPWTKINENGDALDGAYCFAQRKAAHSGLVVAYGGGTFDVNTVADGTVTATDNTTNYLVVNRSTRAVSTSTATTNWNNTATYGRMARAVFAATVLTYHDERFGVGGIFDHGATTTTLASLSDVDIAGSPSPADGDHLVYDAGSGMWVAVPAAAASVATDAIWDAKGDLAGGTGANTAAKLTVGANDTILMAASGEATGLKWATPAQVATAVQADGLDVDAAGFRGIPQNSQSANYTIVAADAGKHLYHPSGGGAGDAFTIPANGSVAFEIGTALTVVNMDSNTLSIAITTDTLYLAGTGSTGSRTLAQYGVATAVKLTSTTWIISGTGLT